tara:strand:+ start:754 stop:1002 length:249 start_codon:yes stop_codon:yes gene_type:complete
MSSNETLRRAKSLRRDYVSTINQYLDNCKEGNTPYICEKIEKDGSREGIIEFVLTLCFTNGMTIGEALSEQERVLDPNYIND